MIKELNMINATPAIAVAKSQNSKLGRKRVAATMASQSSCPKSCQFYKNGCYAEKGYTNLTTLRLNKSAETNTGKIALVEAEEIDKLKGDIPLRLHVVGDSKTSIAVMIVAAAAQRYMEKMGQKVWTYTHAWKWIKRSLWGNVSVLASCETEQDIVKAFKRGYPAAYVVEHFKQETAFALDNGHIGIPCPNQTKGKSCADCQLCMRGPWLHANKRVIVFQKH